MTSADEPAAGWQLEHRGPEAYEAYLVPALFAPWADRLLDRVELGPADRLLDLACGTGIVARRAADRLGEAGRVVGVDVNEGMLAVAREATAGRPPATEWRQAAATALPDDEASFDVVACQQALQFVDDPVAALAEARRVLDGNGWLAVSVWRPVAYNPGYDRLADALERHAGEEAGAMMRTPFPDWDVEHLRGLAEAAGFDRPTVTIEVGDVRYPSAEELVRREAASSPLSGPLGDLEAAVREELVAEVGEVLDDYTDDEGVVFPTEAYFLLARR